MLILIETCVFIGVAILVVALFVAVGIRLIVAARQKQQ